MQDQNNMSLPASPAASSPGAAGSRYWRANLRRIARLLALWLLITMAPALFTAWLSFDLIGWPFPFWLAAYGAPLSYLIIVAVYARVMDRVDRAGRER